MMHAVGEVVGLPMSGPSGARTSGEDRRRRNGSGSAAVEGTSSIQRDRGPLRQCARNARAEECRDAIQVLSS